MHLPKQPNELKYKNFYYNLAEPEIERATSFRRNEIRQSELRRTKKGEKQKWRKIKTAKTKKGENNNGENKLGDNEKRAKRKKGDDLAIYKQTLKNNKTKFLSFLTGKKV